MSRTFQIAILSALLLCLSLGLSTSAQAYVGPGAGISVLGSLLGILATIVLAIGAILMWPIRKMLKRKKAKASALAANAEVTEAQTESAAE